MTNPIELYQKRFCNKCKEKPCQHQGSGIYTQNWNIKLFCILSANLLLELDRASLKKMGKS